MSEDTLKNRILAFAAHIGFHLRDPLEIARLRDWIDDTNRPTDAGRALLAALDDQRSTRTVFRGNF